MDVFTYLVNLLTVTVYATAIFLLNLLSVYISLIELLGYEELRLYLICGLAFGYVCIMVVLREYPRRAGPPPIPAPCWASHSRRTRSIISITILFSRERLSSQSIGPGS